MSYPTQDLPGLQDYLIRKDRELHDRLKQLNEAQKHLQGFPELRESIIEKDGELQKQLTQHSEASNHLKVGKPHLYVLIWINLDQDTSTLNVSEQAKLACSVNNVGTQDDGSGSPRLATATTSREQPSQQPSSGHTPELAAQPKMPASRSPADQEIASQNLRPGPSEVVSCAECGKKTGFVP